MTTHTNIYLNEKSTAYCARGDVYDWVTVRDGDGSAVTLHIESFQAARSLELAVAEWIAAHTCTRCQRPSDQLRSGICGTCGDDLRMEAQAEEMRAR